MSWVSVKSLLTDAAYDSKIAVLAYSIVLAAGVHPGVVVLNAGGKRGRELRKLRSARPPSIRSQSRGLDGIACRRCAELEYGLLILGVDIHLLLLVDYILLAPVHKVIDDARPRPVLTPER